MLRGRLITIVMIGNIFMNHNYNFWKKIWDSKGNSDSTDLLFLDGYEHLGLDFDSSEICSKILEELETKKGDSILEVGCGAGFLAREMQHLDYLGVDYSSPIIEKHKKLFPDHSVLTSESSNLPFEDGSFDYAFCFGLFQYLPGYEYAEKTIQEMTRVSRKAVLLGDLKDKTTRETHFVFPKDVLRDKKFTFTSCFYGSNDVYRYNAILRKKNDLE